MEKKDLLHRIIETVLDRKGFIGEDFPGYFCISHTALSVSREELDYLVESASVFHFFDIVFSRDSLGDQYVLGYGDSCYCLVTKYDIKKSK